MSAFDTAAAALARDANMATDALFKARGVGAGVACRVIRSRPDLVGQGFGTEVILATQLLAVRVAEVPAVAKDDTFTLGAEVLQVRSATRDVENTMWSIEASERGAT
jgi:hypothetical protein